MTTGTVRQCLRRAGRSAGRDVTVGVAVSHFEIHGNQCLHSQAVRKDGGDQVGRQAVGVGSHARARGALRDQSGRPSACPGRRAGGDVGHDSRPDTH